MRGATDASASVDTGSVGTVITEEIMTTQHATTADRGQSPGLEVIERAIDAVNRHDADAYVATYAEGIVVTDPAYPEPLRGREAVRQDIETFLRAFPDVQLTLRQHLVSGETVAVEMIMRGTHTGPLAFPDGEIAATGKPLSLPVAAFITFDGHGLTTENRRYYDVASLLRQLGMT
jgi:steroid delta-isomerase-like uncharacterized protein